MWWKVWGLSNWVHGDATEMVTLRKNMEQKLEIKTSFSDTPYQRGLLGLWGAVKQAIAYMGPEFIEKVVAGNTNFGS